MHQIGQINLEEPASPRTRKIVKHPRSDQAHEIVREELVIAHHHSLHFTIVVVHGDGTRQKQKPTPIHLQRQGEGTHVN